MEIVCGNRYLGNWEPRMMIKCELCVQYSRKKIVLQYKKDISIANIDWVGGNVVYM